MTLILNASSSSKSTPEDVVAAYRLFLGREPENDDVVAAHLNAAPRLWDLVARVYGSTEAAHRRLHEACSQISAQQDTRPVQRHASATELRPLVDHPARARNNRTFFMHVPKTGGISLSSLLRGAFRPHEVCPPSIGDGRWRHRATNVAHYKLFLGHFNTDFINAVDREGFKITILRHPRDRVISTYDFWRSAPNDWNKQLTEVDEDAPSYAKRVTFSEFLKSDIPWVLDGISNSIARQLLGSDFSAYAHNQDAATREACDRLSGFDWYTTTECLSEDLPSLARLFGISEPSDTIIHLNRTYDYEPNEQRPAVVKTTPTEGELQQIDDLNTIDTALYHMAVRQRNTIFSVRDKTT